MPPIQLQYQRRRTIIPIISTARPYRLFVVVVVLLILALAWIVHRLNRTATDAGRQQVQQISVALQMFYTDVGRYPTATEGLQALLKPPVPVPSRWKGPYLSALPRDPWNHPYIYVAPAMPTALISPTPNTSFTVLSYGPDGLPGGGDDILSR